MKKHKLHNNYKNINSHNNINSHSNHKKTSRTSLNVFVS